MSKTPRKSSLADEAASAWQDKLFLGLLAGSGALRLSLTLGLWAVVAFWGTHEPLHVLAHRLRSLDALSYQLDALSILSLWQGNTANAPTEALGFSVLVAVIYKVLTPHPLLISLLGIACYVGVGILAYQISCLMGSSRKQAIFVSVLVASWPSSLVWSVTPLKEGPVLLTIFTLLYCFVRALSGKPLGKWSWLACLCFLAAAAFGLVYLRFYFWYLIWGLLPLIMLSRWRAKGSWLTACSVGAVLAAILIMSMPFRYDGIIHLSKPAKQPISKSWHLIPQAFAEEDVHSKASSQQPPPPDSFFTEMLKKLSLVRRNFARASGASISPEAERGEDSVALINSFNDWPTAIHTIYILVKAGLRDLFLFPYPWQRWPESEKWGPLQVAVSAQMLFWYLLLPGIAAGAIIRIRKFPLSVATLVLWGIGVGMVLSVTILNRGTLFRMRDMALLPLLLIWHPWPYLKLWSLLRRPSEASAGDEAEHGQLPG